MIRLFLPCLLALLLPNLAQASGSSENPPPDCDTLITRSGKTYLVVVGWQGNREIQYRLCGDESGRVYAISRDSIRDLKRQKNLPVQVSPAPKHQLYRDTADLLNLTDGNSYRVIILVRDYLNTYYRLYDDPLDDRQYCVPNQQVRSVRMSKFHTTTAGQKRKGEGCLVILSVVLGIMLVWLIALLSG